MDPDLTLTVAQDFEIETYPLDDPNCQQIPANPETSGLQLENVTLKLWRDGILSMSAMNVTPLEIGVFPLKSKHVSGVHRESIFRRTCDAAKNGPPYCMGKDSREPAWTQFQVGEALRACQSILTPTPTSLEQLALAALISVEKAGRAIHEFLPLLDSQPVTLLAAPRFESRWIPWQSGQQKGNYLNLLAENLAYFPQTSGTPPFIAIFPKQLNSSNPIRLWESEFVTAHEYSHHIEVALGVSRYHENRSLVRVAISEGFADIMAYAALGASDSSIKGIACIGTDRSPVSSTFGNGMMKTIDEVLVGRLPGGSKANESQDLEDESAFLGSGAKLASEQPSQFTSVCRGVVPHSAHGLGAIFSHWVAMFASMTPGFDEAPAKSVALLATDWITAIDGMIGAGSHSNTNDLRDSAKALEKAIEQRYAAGEVDLTDNIKLLLCQKMKLAFPAVKEIDWFGRSGC